MNFWVDVETSAGVKQGLGPILTAVSWRNIRRLDKAGEFSFQMPANDPAAAVLAHKLIARCWSIQNGVMTEQGAGIIDKIVVKPGAPSMIEVSGSDLLRELTYISVGELDISKLEIGSPVESLVVRPGDDVDLPNTIDGNTGTYNAHAFILHEPAADYPGDYWYIEAETRFAPWVNVILKAGGAVNNNASTIAIQWYNAVESGWHLATTTVVDGTDSGGASLAQSGAVTWADNMEDWAPNPATGHYTVRFRWDVDLDTVDIAEVQVKLPVATDAPLTLLAAIPSWPVAWTFDAVTGHAETEGEVYKQFAGENILEALVAIAEQTGEHFRLGAGRTIVWLQNDPLTAVAGVRCVQVPDAKAAESETTLALITSLEQSRDTYDLITRIIPYGAGFGSARVTLARTDRTAPGGYELDKPNNWIRLVATDDVQKIERWLAWKDISAKENAEPHLTEAANALYDAALVYLIRNSAAQYAYSLSVAKLDTAVYPGDRVHVEYDEWCDGYHSIAIDADLIVLSTTTEISGQGLRTVAMEVSTIDAWPRSDEDLLVDGIRMYTALARRPQVSQGNTVTAMATSSPPLEVSADRVLASSGAGNAWWRLVSSLMSAHAMIGALHTLPVNAVAGEVVTVNATEDGWELTTPTGGGGYDVLDGILAVDASATQALLELQAPTAFDIVGVVARCAVEDVTLSIYVGTAYAAIVITHNVDNTWTVERFDPSDGSAISTWTSSAGDSFGLRTFTGTDILAVAVDTRIRSELVVGDTAITDGFSYGLKGS